MGDDAVRSTIEIDLDARRPAHREEDGVDEVESRATDMERGEGLQRGNTRTRSEPRQTAQDGRHEVGAVEGGRHVHDRCVREVHAEHVLVYERERALQADRGSAAASLRIYTRVRIFLPRGAASYASSKKHSAGRALRAASIAVAFNGSSRVARDLVPGC